MSKIEVVSFGPTQEQIDFRKAIAHRVHPVVVQNVLAGCKEVGELTAKQTAALTMMFVDALIEKLEE